MRKYNILKNRAALLLFLILFSGLFFRCFNLNWDDGHFLHPDERLYVNASNITIPSSFNSFFSSSSPLNPHMFYYGTFPLYLYKIASILFYPSQDFLFVSRLVSALFSTATIFFIFLSGKKLFNTKVGLLAAFCFAYAPGSIQYAHFNTTESILIFLLTAILYFSIKIYDKFSVWNILILAALSSFSYATKITGLTFLLFPGLVLLSLLLGHSWKKSIIFISIFIPVFLVLAFLSAPYQIIDWKMFSDQQAYMQGVTLGKSKPPFVIIYENTHSYLYPLLSVFPFIFGFITVPLGILGSAFIIKAGMVKKRFKYLYLYVLIFPFFYFLWAGSWFVKFERYYLLLLPFIAIWAGYTLHKINKKIILLILLLVIFLNGALYLKVYLSKNTRVAASLWIYKNIKPGSALSGEHWDDSLPMPIPGSYPETYKLIQLPVYDPDTRVKIEKLSYSLSHSDYFIISSGRVYRSILVNANTYPLTSSFYKLLLSGKLGFSNIKSFSNYPFIFSDDSADESFQSYDHPPVLIFKNIKNYSSKKLFQLIQNGN